MRFLIAHHRAPANPRLQWLAWVLGALVTVAAITHGI